MDRAFVVMQVGPVTSLERQRADEVYGFIIRPALQSVNLEPYRADLDPSPGGITDKVLGELVGARLIIADLTGRNPNVFYELGIAHSFAKPLISIADTVASLPFDAKDERIIALGDYAPSGLTYAQGEAAKASLAESLRVVLAPGYRPPSPLRELAANRSLDDLAPDNPIAAELSQMRAALEDVSRMREDVQKLLQRPQPNYVVPTSMRAEVAAMKSVVEGLAPLLSPSDFEALAGGKETSKSHKEWVQHLRALGQRGAETDPWADAPVAPDPWADAPVTKSGGGWSDEPPFWPGSKPLQP